MPKFQNITTNVQEAAAAGGVGGSQQLLLFFSQRNTHVCTNTRSYKKFPLRKIFRQELSQKTKDWELCNTGSVATFPSNLHGSSKGKSMNMPACHRKLWELFHGHA
jgi:hypothetical protein